MRRIILLAIIPFIMAARVAGSPVEQELHRLESRLENSPDSVLTALENFDRAQLRCRSDRAYFSLLYSQALDKNYILVTTDSIIAPAVNYYSRHGRAEDQLKTCYYRALIAENANDPDLAMEWLKKGEMLVSSASCPSLFGRLYSHKAYLYYNSYDYRDALTNFKTASFYFDQDGDYVSYSYSQADVANTLICLEEFQSAEDNLRKVKEHWDEIDEYCKAKYYLLELQLAIDLEDTSAMEALLKSCSEDIPDYEDIYGLNLKMAQGYLYLGKNDQAGRLLKSYDSLYDAEEKDQAYYFTLSEYYEKTGDYRNALEAMKDFNFATSTTTVKALSSDTKFVEERYEAQIQAIKNKQKTSSFVMTALLLMGIAILIIRYVTIALGNVRRELAETTTHYKEIMDERNALNSIQENSTVLGSEAMSVVQKRLALLDKVLVGYMSGDPSLSREADKDIEQLLENKDKFILNTAQVFAASRPKFVKFLKSHNLTEKEIGYCCLFLMGMYSKDIEPYFSKATSTSMSSIIRSKLKLPQNGIKLKTFLLTKLEELDN